MGVVALALSLISPRIGYVDVGIIILGAMLLIHQLTASKFGRRDIINTQFRVMPLLAATAACLLVFLAPLVEALGPSAVYYPLRITRVIILISLYSAFIETYHLDQKCVLRAVAYAALVHSAVVYLQVLDFGGTGIFFRKLNLTSGIEIMQKPRGMGFSAGYDSAGLFCAFGFLSSYLLALSGEDCRPKKVLRWSLSAIFCGSAVFLSSRIGQLAVLFFLVGLSVYTAVKSPFSWKGRLWFGGLWIMFLLGLALWLAVLLLKPYLADSLVYSSFELYRNLLGGAGLATASSTDTWNNHYVIPSQLSDIVFGVRAGLYRSDGYLVSDVGWVQILIGHGLFGLLAAIIYLAATLYLATKKDNRNTEGDFLIKPFAVLSLIAILLGSFKGPYLFSKQLFDVVILSIITLNCAQTYCTTKSRQNTSA